MMETGEARAKTDAVMTARRGVDLVVPMALVAADQDAGRKVAAVPKVAALVIVVLKGGDQMADGADRMALLQVDREQGDRKGDPGVAPADPMALVTAVQDVDPKVAHEAADEDLMVLLRADLVDHAAAARVAARVLAQAGPVDLEGLSSGWIRLTTSSTRSCGKLNP
ncbi:MAG: hypothetical protein ACKVP0_13955 [Pirellulaceae bacterium]